MRPHIHLNFKFVTTAAFLLSTLLIAGCASQAATAATPDVSPAAETTPVETADTSGGVHAGETHETYAALSGAWTLARVEDTAEDADTAVTDKELHFRDDGTGFLLADGAQTDFEFALEGDHLTLVTDGGVETWQCTLENAEMVLARIDNDGTLETRQEIYSQTSTDAEATQASE